MELNERIVKLEEGQEHHDGRLEKLETKTDNMHHDLQELKNLLHSIKWWLYGIGTFYIVSEVGLTVALKKYFGI
jgi:chromosome segregation ATPase